jgi:hypothetical protein
MKYRRKYRSDGLYGKNAFVASYDLQLTLLLKNGGTLKSIAESDRFILGLHLAVQLGNSGGPGSRTLGHFTRLATTTLLGSCRRHRSRRSRRSRARSLQVSKGFI